MSTEQRVEDYLIVNGPATATEIATALESSQPTVQRALATLTTAGNVSAYAFDQKLYSARRKPTTMKALLKVQLCAIARMLAAYDSQVRKHGLENANAKLTEALRTEMIRWSEVINSQESEASREV